MRRRCQVRAHIGLVGVTDSGDSVSCLWPRRDYMTAMKESLSRSTFKAPSWGRIMLLCMVNTLDMFLPQALCSSHFLLSGQP